ncbi:hypothetical protein ACJIZ3_012591 [Penstemon smallii]|uniref:Uncharacterized protein n=1 Tax=Penstemon smallii TaxID=265156 RepID=A0ABD3UMH1_9LAMI
MGEMASLWGYEENNDTELKLLITTLELEKIKAEAREEIMKKNEYSKKLIQLLKLTMQERDEAKEQLQKLLNKTTNTLTTNTENFPVIKPNSTSITESNSLSETYNYHSSPVESFFDTVSSPEFSNINLVVEPKLDHASLIIDNIVKGKVLPQKGKFLQSVLEAGPLLQTLLVAGPLPRWRNPPQLQPFQIPPVTIKGYEGAEVFGQKQGSNVVNLGSKSLNSQTYAQMSCGSAQVQSGPMLNFGNLGSGTSGINNNGYVSLAKRQRFF